MARILVIDGYQFDREWLKSILEKDGFEVVVATEGLQAINMAQGISFDLALLDMDLPNFDGYATTKAFRALGFSKPIIAVTAYEMSDDRRLCLEAGCDEHLAKSEALKKLIPIIRRHLNSARPSC